MQFTNDKPIYQQIIDLVMEKILKKEWAAGEKILSVRDLGATLEVNPNTIMRSYEKLQQDEIIFNKRGLGFFVAEDAQDRIIGLRKESFLEQEAPRFLQTAKLLNISLDEITDLYNALEL